MREEGRKNEGSRVEEGVRERRTKEGKMIGGRERLGAGFAQW